MTNPSLFDDGEFAYNRPVRTVPVGEHLRAAPRARHSDPVTSMDAAETVAQNAGRLESLIRITVSCHPNGMTDDEIAAVLPNRHPPTVKTARSRLTKRGKLVDSGDKRPSAQGCPMVVWRLA